MTVSRPARARWALVAVAAAVGALAVACSADEQAGPSPSTTALEGQCAQVHEGHPVHDGGAAMMWTPVMADEMLDADCGWPYEPFDPGTAGGSDDPELDAPFEANRYDDLWQMLGSAGMALCSVGSDAEPRDGRAFGFVYQVADPGCPEGTPTGSMQVDEYGTEAQRDAAARAASAEQGDTFVMGRWVLVLDGTARELGDELSARGAQPVQ